MIKTKILTDNKMPFCQACGHGIIVKSIAKTLEQLGYSNHDTIIVSDIGCSGLVDPLFDTHTIHGLHGRAPALGVGVSLGLDNPNKKVIVIQGDGGVTIGLQHVLESARRNIDITLIVMNNLLYGMTGGQISGLSTQKFKEQRNFEVDVPPFDIVRLAHASGSAFSARSSSIKQYGEILKEGIETNGFAIVELSSLCTSYAYKKITELHEVIEDAEVYRNERVPVRAHSKERKTLFNKLEEIEVKYTSNIKEKIGVVMAGSAGGGVQSAAKLLAMSGMRSGLFSTMKGEYPVTVGTGFSVAEIILSKTNVNYTGLENPEVVIIVSIEGLNKVKDRINKNSILLVDVELKEHNLKNAIYGNFNKISGKRGAALTALAYWMLNTKTVDIESLKTSVSNHKYSSTLLTAIDNAGKLDVSK